MFAPKRFNRRQSHAPLNPVCPVTSTLLLCQKLDIRRRPHFPWGSAGIPDTIQQLMFSRCIHALPEPIVAVGLQLVIEGSVAQRRVLQRLVLRADQLFQGLLFKYHEAAIDVTGGSLWLFMESPDHSIIVQGEFSESAGGMYSRKCYEFLAAEMVLVQVRHVDICDCIAVGQEKAIIVIVTDTLPPDTPGHLCGCRVLYRQALLPSLLLNCPGGMLWACSFPSQS